MRALRAMGAAAGVAVLAACGSAPTVPGAEVRTGADEPRAAPVVADPALQRFVQGRMAAAERDEAQGRWADAEAAWDQVLLAQPDHPAAALRAAAAGRRARSEADAQQARADALRQRGQLDAAATAYLEVLVLDPGRPAAADALRQIEAEREHRRLDNRNLRLGAPARRMDEPPPATAAGGDDAARRLGAAREHAAMLSAQGDLDGAIQVLKEAMPARPDARARTALADLYVRKGDALREIDRKAARAAVDAALALDRRHVAARALQRQLAAPPAADAKAPSRP